MTFLSRFRWFAPEPFAKEIVMFCEACGHRLGQEACFCSACGQSKAQPVPVGVVATATVSEVRVNGAEPTGSSGASSPAPAEDNSVEDFLKASGQDAWRAPQPQRPPVSCAKCDKTFTNAHGLADHERLHMPGNCSQCGRKSNHRVCDDCSRARTAGRPSTSTLATGFPVPASPGSGYSTAALILGAIAFLFFPIVLGPAGLILAAVGMSKGEKNAAVGMTVAACGTVIGMILGAAVFAAA